VTPRSGGSNAPASAYLTGIGGADEPDEKKPGPTSPSRLYNNQKQVEVFAMRKTLIMTSIAALFAGSAMAADMKAEADADTKLKAGVEAGTESGAKADADAKADTDAKAGMKAEEETGAEADAEAGAGADVDAGADTDAGISTEGDSSAIDGAGDAVGGVVDEAGDMADDTAVGVGDTTGQAITVAEAVGKDVRDSAGEKVGKVVGVLHDSSGGVKSVLVETGGILLGLGSRTVEVPANQVNVDTEAAVVAMSEAEIESLPEYQG
jgi:sporulation protein YlmC with PRC-barrel domain